MHPPHPPPKSATAYDATVDLQLRALWSEVIACLANCWQKIAISPQVMFSNIWHNMYTNRLSKSLSFLMFVNKCTFLQLSSKINAIFSIL